MKLGFLSAILLASTLIFSSCSKTSSNEKAILQVRLADDPGAYDAVNIDIRDVQINVTGNDDQGWQSLPGVKAGVYNLLDLVNGKDTLLADADIPSGKLHQIRLVLGTNNTIVLNGVSTPLATPSAEQSGLKLNVQQDVKGGILYTMLLDFDCARSIVATGSGTYKLKPVIRTVLNAVGGSIKGAVAPGSIRTAVYAINGTDTMTTFTDTSGGFLIKGVPAAIYDLKYWPSDAGYMPQSKSGIVVTAGNVTVVDTVRLQQ